MKLFPLRLTTLVLGSLFLLNGGVTPSSASPSGNSRGLRVPQSFTRMFDGQCFSAKIFILAPPFYPSPAPVAAIAQSCGNAIAFDPADGAFVVTSGAVFGKLSVNVYRPPYSSVSVPAVSFSPSALSHPRQVAWDGSGNVWLSDDAANRVYEFRAPFSPSSVPAAENALATQPVGLAIDPEAGLMFVGDVGGSSACAKTSCRIDVVRAPYTGAPVVTLALGDSTPAALAVDEMGRLFVGFESGSSKAPYQSLCAALCDRRIRRLHARCGRSNQQFGVRFKPESLRAVTRYGRRRRLRWTDIGIGVNAVGLVRLPARRREMRAKELGRPRVRSVRNATIQSFDDIASSW